MNSSTVNERECIVDTNEENTHDLKQHIQMRILHQKL